MPSGLRRSRSDEGHGEQEPISAHSSGRIRRNARQIGANLKIEVLQLWRAQLEAMVQACCRAHRRRTRCTRRAPKDSGLPTLAAPFDGEAVQLNPLGYGRGQAGQQAAEPAALLLSERQI